MSFFLKLEKFIPVYKIIILKCGVVAKPGIATGSRSYNGQIIEETRGSGVQIIYPVDKLEQIPSAPLSNKNSFVTRKSINL